MNTLLLSRIQFGINAGFHFIFPPITLGLTLILAIIETKFYFTRNEQFKKISGFIVKILALVFAIGVATGIVLEFAFGTNWANYSKTVGDIFGAPLAAEGIFAFFLESVFIGVLIYGRNRVSARTYWISALLVFFASHLSGLWIIIANSWMHTPAGFQMVQGRAVLTDFMAAIFNPSMIERFTHTIIAAWITGTLFLAGIASWFLLKKRYTDNAKTMLVYALIVFSVSAILQFGTGHAHSSQVAHTNPERMASFEALWETQKGAPMSIIGLPDPVAKQTHFEIAIPKLLSLLIHLDSNAEVQGLNAFPDDELPPLVPVYITYHLMIGMGLFYALIALISVILIANKKLGSQNWFLYLLVAAAPLPIITNELGWVSAEMGRQPWAVYRILKTADAVSSTVPPGNVLFSLIGFSLIYCLLFALFIAFLFKIINKGMDDIKAGY